MSDEILVKDPNLTVSQLTSLRGVACLVVLVGHVVQVFHYHAVGGTDAAWLARVCITSAFNAEGAVLLFFVLSGCVLSLSLRNLSRLEPAAVVAFYLRRVFRIYPLLWLAVGVAMLSMIAAHKLLPQAVFVDWLQRNLGTPLTAPHTLLSLTGFYTRYNGPMWSLRVELIYSVLFPFLFMLVRNRRSRIPVLAALLALAALPLPTQAAVVFGLSFAIGALIPVLPKSAGRLHGAWVLAALLVLLYDRLALRGLHPPERVYDVVESLAAFVLVRDIYGCGGGYRPLTWRPMVLLGEFSYSVYLLHLPILLLIFASLASLVGVPALLDRPTTTPLLLSLLTVLVTVPVSALTYRFVELPMHNLGRRLSRQVGQGTGWRQKGAAAAAPRA